MVKPAENVGLYQSLKLSSDESIQYLDGQPLRNCGFRNQAVFECQATQKLVNYKSNNYHLATEIYENQSIGISPWISG